MYRTVKLLYGCANVFVLYPLIIYVLSTTLLLAAEGAQAPPLPSVIKEAEKIVGQFLRNEAGTSWLSGLAKSRSAPLTTQDLMNEIMAATRPGGKVWKAASILSESLSESLKGMGTDSVLGQPENWKDLIEHIENEKDIICLYRKNNEQAAEKENDWKTFLRTVSPGYTVHLAIDTGTKYVICLKKIEVSEISPEDVVATEKIETNEEIVTTGEIMTTEENSSTIDTSVDPTLAEAETMLPITSENQENVVSRKSPNIPNDIRRNNRDKNCTDEDQASGEVREGRRRNPKLTRSQMIEALMKTYDDDYDSDEEFGRRPVNSGKTWHSPIRPSMKKNGLYLGNNGRPYVNSQLGTRDGLNSLSPKDHECNRPIIVVMQNGDTPLGYQPWTPSGNPIHKNLGEQKLTPYSLHSVPYRINPQHRPTHSFKMSGPPFNPLTQPNNIPSFSNLNNRGSPIADQKQRMYMASPRPMRSRIPVFLHPMPREKIQRSIVQSYAEPIVKPVAQSNMMPVARPNMQTARNGFVPHAKMQIARNGFVPHAKMQIARNGFVPHAMNMQPQVSQGPDIIQDLRSPFENYFPRRMEDWPRPRSPHSHLRRPTKLPKWYVPRNPSRNVAIPRRSIPVKPNLVDNTLLTKLARGRNSYSNRDSLEDYNNPQLLPRAPVFGSRLPIMQKPNEVHPWIRKSHYPLSTDMNLPGRQSSKTPSKFLGRSLSPPFQGINGGNFPLINKVRQNSPKQNRYRNPLPNLNPNYPMANNFVQPNARTPLTQPLFTCFNLWRNLNAIGKNNPDAINSLAQSLATCRDPLACAHARNQLERGSGNCPRLCDRPVKLQIFVNGKVQEPLTVSVISESGQQVEIVGSGQPIVPYGGRNLKEGTPLLSDVEVNEEEVRPPINNLQEVIADAVDDKLGQNQEDLKYAINEAVSAVESMAEQSGKLDEKNNSTTEFTPETTSVGLEAKTSGVPEVGERFLNEVTPETSSEDSAAEVDTTVPAITNSTMIEY